MYAKKNIKKKAIIIPSNVPTIKKSKIAMIDINIKPIPKNLKGGRDGFLLKLLQNEKIYHKCGKFYFIKTHAWIDKNDYKPGFKVQRSINNNHGIFLCDYCIYG